MDEKFVLSARGLSVGYQGKPIIRDIRFELPRGCILTLIGPNGAGKSTILKTLIRQLAAIGGTAFIEGTELKDYHYADLARKLAVMLTERVRPELMSCFDVAAMGRYPYTGRFGMLSDADRETVNRALSRVQALDIAERDFNRISDGQRQRVLLARALCQEPDVLVLDEPTSFLDIRHKIDLLEILLEEARSRQITVVLSLHEIDLAEKISDYVMCVKGDRIERFGPPKDVFDDGIIAALYGLDAGAYLTRRGSVELARPEGKPEVFVIGGAGCGIRHYRALQKKRLPFAVGILFENDMEYDVAKALAQCVVSAPAFSAVAKETYDQALKLMLQCGRALDTGAPVGEFNRYNGLLLEEARKRGLEIARDVNELDIRD